MREPGSHRRVQQTDLFGRRLVPPPEVIVSDTGRGRLERLRRGQEASPEHPDPQPQGVYVISVAARIVSMHPQTLRKYERAGLLKPSRTEGMLRLYTPEDIVKLRMIKHLVDNVRLNLAGVEVVMSMVERLMEIRAGLAPARNAARRALERELEDLLSLFQST